MMKSTITKRTYRAIYRLLDRVSPVPYDCGTLCGTACCTGGPDREAFEAASENEDEGAMGIYLLPGEDKLHSKHDDWLTWTEDDVENYDFPESWTGKVFFVNCNTPPHCPRDKRPIQCRTFPLAPHIMQQTGELVLIYNDVELPYRCPLIEDDISLDGAFVRATYTAWKHLIRDPLIYDLVKMDSDDRDEDYLEIFKLL
ncbi:MAG: hypothetical protein K5767_00260 [Clostridia bacterium]|nr:hypothetical protein [Clostridia bacterium]